jgi:Holliday junction DNA helicase RuvA
MIEKLKGILKLQQKNKILLEVNGIGFGIFVSKKVIENLCPLNEELEIITHLDVKEDSLTLYGFFDDKEKEMFKLLNTVSGISSKTAHNILSYAGFAEIIGLITDKQNLRSFRIPGIGPKKLDMISIALRDKILKLTIDIDTEEELKSRSIDYTSKEQPRMESAAALMNLGYQRSEAEKLIREVLRQNEGINLTTEEIIKKALELIS